MRLKEPLPLGVDSRIIKATLYIHPPSIEYIFRLVLTPQYIARDPPKCNLQELSTSFTSRNPLVQTKIRLLFILLVY